MSWAAVQPAPVGDSPDVGRFRVPQGYVLCDGQPLRKSDHPELFNAIGSTFNTLR
ncbi:tail fiber protein [Duncaniella freteri]|uniref:Tail fiber protein n=1 Tax=Duncaniella freteri TaxID=2530391 RepID=A0A4Z0VBX1_9BACT|nr:tail fiber protein [Duncaniella freteri]